MFTPPVNIEARIKANIRAVVAGDDVPGGVPIKASAQWPGWILPFFGSRLEVKGFEPVRRILLDSPVPWRVSRGDRAHLVLDWSQEGMDSSAQIEAISCRFRIKSAFFPWTSTSAGSARVL